MLCWSCGKEVAENATRCSYCEADVLFLPDNQEMEMARDFLDKMDPTLMREFRRIFEASETGEEFVNKIMVGDCPECGSSETGNCEHDPDVEDVTIGRCFECGHLWCTGCDSRYEEGQDFCDVCSDLEDGWSDGEPNDDAHELDRYSLLAAEIFGYSFANYRDHLGIENERYDEIMPHAARVLERALEEKWPVARVAEELFPGETVDEKEALEYLAACKDALQVVNAENAAESFRNAVRLSVQRAMKDGLSDDASVEDLVVQICYRASDLAVLLDQEGQPLSRYSRHLRREKDVDYYDGYFDE